jgi:hypothetical protein
VTPEKRRYAIVAFGIGPAVANTLINGLLGWATFRGMELVPIWSTGPSVGPDTLGTCFFLPFFTCLIATALTRRDRRQGKVTSLAAFPPSLQVLRRMPGPLFRRALAIGLATFVGVGGLVLAGLSSLDTETMPHGRFLGFKIGFSVVLGLMVTPPIGVLALADPLPEAAST